MTHAHHLTMVISVNGTGIKGAKPRFPTMVDPCVLQWPPGFPAATPFVMFYRCTLARFSKSVNP